MYLAERAVRDLCATPRSLPGRFERRLTRHGATREGKRRETAVLFAMIPAMVRKSRFGEYAARRHETRNTPPRELMPAYVERGKLRKKLQLAVRQVVMNPP